MCLPGVAGPRGPQAAIEERLCLVLVIRALEALVQRTQQGVSDDLRRHSAPGPRTLAWKATLGAGPESRDAGTKVLPWPDGSGVRREE